MSDYRSVGSTKSVEAEVGEKKAKFEDRKADCSSWKIDSTMSLSSMIEHHILSTILTQACLDFHHPSTAFSGCLVVLLSSSYIWRISNFFAMVRQWFLLPPLLDFFAVDD